jgi:hypothetical protein
MHEHRSGEQDFQAINSESSTSVSHRVHNFTAETLAVGICLYPYNIERSFEDLHCRSWHYVRHSYLYPSADNADNSRLLVVAESSAACVYAQLTASSANPGRHTTAARTRRSAARRIGIAGRGAHQYRPG